MELWADIFVTSWTPAEAWAMLPADIRGSGGLFFNYRGNRADDIIAAILVVFATSLFGLWDKPFLIG